jgi:hypothetical protein
MRSKWYLGLLFFYLTHDDAFGQQHGSPCLEKICEQTITGRNLPYPRILQILHTREYLNAIHLDKIPPDIRHRKKRLKRQATHTGVHSEIMSHSLNSPMLLGVPLMFLSLLFVASLRRRGHHKPQYVAQSAHHKLPSAVVNYVEEPPVIIQISPPLIPKHVPQPGQPGGGLDPALYGDYRILGLVPEGLVLIAVFPRSAHYGDRDSPSDCVLFAEPDPLPYYGYDPYRFKRARQQRLTRSVSKKSRKVSRNGLHHPTAPHHQHLIEVPAFERLYGFRCLVTVIDRKPCNSLTECKKVQDYEAHHGQGYFFKKQVMPAVIPDYSGYHQYQQQQQQQQPNYSYMPTSYGRRPFYGSTPIYYGSKASKQRRSMMYGPEFYPDDLPQCRIHETPFSLDCKENNSV